MIIKWMICDVREQRKMAFSRAQEGWNRLRYVQGFCGQIGGWNVNRPWEACFIGFWRDLTFYRMFMRDYHDRIFSENQQAGTYDGISISLLHTLDEVAGLRPTMVQVISKAQFLRVADFTTRVNSRWNVLEEQQEVWNPALERADGMVAGLFSQEEGAPQRFLVSSLWSHEEGLKQFRDEKSARLKAHLNYQDDVHRFVSRTIKLEDTWRVLPDQ